MAAPMKNADILMVGKTGTGKSALGNMILQKKAFVSENQLQSVTKYVQYDYSQFEDTVIKIVDGPGVGDTMEDKAAGINLVVEAMQRAVMISVEGFHSILIVVRYGGRFTDEDVQTIHTLKGIFGDTFVANHGILVITCGDLFEKDAQEENDGETFEQWCQKQGGIFSKLLAEVKNRVILFNNRAKGEACYQQIRRLLHMIEGQCSNGARYTSKVFEDAQQERDRLMVESKRPYLQQSAICEAGLITQELGRPDPDNPEKELCRLNTLKVRAETLHQRVIEQDQGTNSLVDAIQLTENLIKTITSQLETLKKSIELREEAKKLRRKLEAEKDKHLLDEKRGEEQLKREVEERRSRKEDEEKRWKEEKEERRKEDKRIHEVGERQSTESAMIKMLEAIKDGQERFETHRRDEERRQKERQEDERRAAEWRDAEKKRDEQWRLEDERRQEQWRLEEKIRQEQRRLDEEKLQDEKARIKEEQREQLEMYRREIERLEQEKQNEIEIKGKEIEKQYQEMKKKENTGFFSAMGELVITGIKRITRFLK